MKPLKPCGVLLTGGPANGALIAWSTATGVPPPEWLVPMPPDFTTYAAEDEPSTRTPLVVARYRRVSVSWYTASGDAVGVYVYQGVR